MQRGREEVHPGCIRKFRAEELREHSKHCISLIILDSRNFSRFCTGVALVDERRSVHGVQHGAAQGGEHREIESDIARRQHEGVGVASELAEEARARLDRVQVQRKMARGFRGNPSPRKIEPVSSSQN